MYLNDIMKKNIEHQDQLNSRYFITKLDGFDAAILTEITTNEKFDLTIKMYQTDLFTVKNYIKPFIENPFQKKNIFDYLTLACILDDENKDNPRPMCEASATIWDSGVTLNNIHTREDVRRKGLASYALKLIQDYYSRNPNVKTQVPKIGGERMLYCAKYPIESTLQYKTRYEHENGAFGDLLSRVKAKVLKRDAKKAFINFLAHNHFICEDHTYQMPHRSMYSRNILSDKIIDENTSRNHFQIFDGLIEYEPSETVRDM